MQVNDIDKVLGVAALQHIVSEVVAKLNQDDNRVVDRKVTDTIVFNTIINDLKEGK